MENLAHKQIHILFMVKVFLLLISLLIISFICFKNLEHGFKYVLLLLIIAIIIIECISFYIYLPIETYHNSIKDDKKAHNIKDDKKAHNDKQSSYVSYDNGINDFYSPPL